MKIVLDANVIFLRFWRDDRTGVVRRLMRRASAVCVPSLWRHEVLSALRGQLFAGAPRDGLVRAYRRAVSLFEPFEEQPDPVRVLALVERFAADGKHASLSAYDAQYVALAIDQGAVLVTLDAALRAKFPELALTLEDAVDS